MLTGMMSDYLGVVFWLFLALGIVAALRALWFLMAQIGFAAWAVPLIVSATAFFTAGFLHEKAASFRAMSGGADTSFGWTYLAMMFFAATFFAVLFGGGPRPPKKE
ncbi:MULTISPECIES: hypothetical protein [Enterobacterales]|nr:MULTISPECIES: hypothetical protein [Enterobacterales]ESS51972.1 hypothetical protein L665_05034 [Ralstonia solanacearum SD54]RQG48550.1 hypothetical protein IPC203_31080 [Pseudomonas aeruginosa]HCC5807334.1 hypothetical protein [Escherichia coli]MDX7641547.1 hypothetical protein [Citrobacter portucalensis]MVD51982.1 hypothetical protein [Proteus mirabilis]